MIQSPYRRGADDGLIFGIYLSVMFFTSIFSGIYESLSLISFMLMVGVPAVIYIFMRRYDRTLGVAGTFAMLWMQGVVIFFCGMLIAGMLLVVYMKWIEPDFVLHQLQSVASLKGALPDSQIDMVADVAQKMIDNRFIPTPIDIVVEMLMLAIVSGSLLSMAISGIFAARRRKSTHTSPRQN